MKFKKLMTLSLIAALSLTACNQKAPEKPETKPQETQVQTEKQTENQTEAKDTKPEETKETIGEPQTQAPEKKHEITLKIDGYDQEHYPILDGSLANVPLLVRMMKDMTGVDEETAEAFMSGSFVNGGTSTSWGRLVEAGEDLLISYEPPAEVKEYLIEDLERLEIDPLGRDGLVFIVNVNNPIESLTVDQIRDIYTGKITDWSEVGGPKGAIKAFQRNSTSGSQTLLQKLVLGDLEAVEPEKEFLIGDMGGLIEAVANFDGSDMAIGFSVYYYADRMKSNPNLKMIKVDGVAPNNETIGNNSYPLVNDFYIAIRANEPENSPVRQLRDWMLTEDGRTLLEEEAYVWAREGMEAKSHGAGNIFR